jgi:hypothetical protein
MPEARSATTKPTPPRRTAGQRKPHPSSGGRVAANGGPELRRRVDTAGDALASLASAGETPSASDRVLAQAFSRLERLGGALRDASAELAIERRRTSALRKEIRRLRSELPRGGRGMPSAG